MQRNSNKDIQSFDISDISPATSNIWAQYSGKTANPGLPF